jgi:translation initiation factor IF-2
LRPPIVSVLGHVDHGKTTLLDYIRKTSVAEKEVGGITQSTGASKVKTKDGKEITFIDTPGHAAFSNMRSRGAKVADIAILVVAADDGVKPQTKEALEYILSSQIPFIVAATKTDLSSSSVDNVRNQLEKEGVSFEGRGGEIPLVVVSGKTGKGVDDLLEVVGLVAELHEIKGNTNDDLQAVVIETGKDKGGPTVTVVVRNGSLKVGDQVIAETTKAKIRGLFDFKGKSVKSCLPGDSCLILGFSELPPVGSRVWEEQEEGGKIIFADKKPIAIGRGRSRCCY